MKVNSLVPITAEVMVVDHGPTGYSDWQTFTRYGSKAWTVSMGESDEPVYSDIAIAELEQTYQNYKEKLNK